MLVGELPVSHVSDQEMPVGAKGRKHEDLESTALQRLLQPRLARLAGQSFKQVEIYGTCITGLAPCLAAIATPSFGFVYHERECHVGFAQLRVGDEPASGMKKQLL